MFDDPTIKIVVDSTPARKGSEEAKAALSGIALMARNVERDLAKLGGAANAASAQLSKIDAPVRRVGQGASLAAKGINDTEKSIKALEKASILIQGPLGGVAARVSALHSAFTAFNGTLVAQVGVITALSAASVGLVTYGDKYVQLTNKIKAFSEAGQDVTPIFQKLTEAANRARTPVDNLVDVFAKVKQASNVLKISGDEAVRFSETVSKAAALSGSTLQSQQAALYQFGQALSANFQSSGQEIASIREQASVLGNIIEKGINQQLNQSGAAYQTLKQLAAEGKINSERVYAAVMLNANAMDAMVSKTQKTVGQSFAELGNNLTQFFGEVNKATGATSILANSISFVAKNVDNLAALIGVLTVSFGVYKLIGLTTMALTALSGAIRTAMIVDALASGVAGLTVAQRAATAATFVFNGALTLLAKNPIAISVIAITGAFVTLGSQIGKTSREIEAFGKSADEALAKYKSTMNEKNAILRQGNADEAEKALPGVQTEIRKMKAEMNHLKDATNSWDAAKVMKLKEELVLLNQKEGALIGTIREGKKPYEDHNLQIKNYSDLAKEAIKDTETQTERINKQIKTYQEGADALGGILGPRTKDQEEQYQALKTAVKRLEEDKQKILDKTDEKERKAEERKKKVEETAVRRAQATKDRAQREADQLEGLQAQVLAYADAVGTPAQKLQVELNKIDTLQRKLGKNATEENLAILEQARERARKTAEEALDGTTAEANQMKKILNSVAEDIQQSFANMFSNIVKDGRISFKSLGADIKGVFAKIAGDMASLAIGKSVIAPAISLIGGAVGADSGIINSLTSKFGAAPTSGGGGILNTLSALKSFGSVSGMLDSLGSNSLGFGYGQALDMWGARNLGTSLPSASGGVSGSLGGVLGGAGIGATIGSLNLFGGKQTGSTIGGAIGGAAGSFIPIPVVGTLIGSALGSAIGGMFGAGAPTQASEFSSTVGSSGIIKSTYGSKNADIKIAKGLATQVGQLTEFLSSAGINTAGTSLRGGYNTNQRGGGFFDVNNKTIKFNAEDADSVNTALVSLTKEFMSMANVVDNNMITALKNVQTEGRSLSDVLGDIGFAAAYNTFSFANDNTSALEQTMKELNARYAEAIKKANELGLSENKIIVARDKQLKQVKDDFNKSVRMQTLQIIDPTSYALKQLVADFVELRRNAIATGGNLVAVENLFALKREQLLKQSTEAQTSVLTEQLSKIASFRDSLKVNQTLSAGSRFTVQQESEKQFNALADRISAGDKTAFNDLESVSRQYLEASLDYFGPTEKYLSRLEQVYKLLDSSEAKAGQVFDVNSAILDQNTQQTDLLKKLVEKYNTGSSTLAGIGSIAQSALLRPGESASVLSSIDKTSGLSQQLTRSIKYLASNGEYNFATSQGWFQDYVKSHPEVGSKFLTLLEMLGGSGASTYRANFGFANGTGNTMFAGGLALVGEKGPELVNFGRPAQIVSNDNSQGLLSAGNLVAVFRDYQMQSAKETAVLADKLDEVSAKVAALAVATEMTARMKA